MVGLDSNGRVPEGLYSQRDRAYIVRGIGWEDEA